MNSRTVLHVEDDESLVLLFRRVLQRGGFAYHPVFSFAEATRYLRQEHEFADRVKFPPPDVVITDISVSGATDAPQFVSWLREQPQFARTLVIVLTGGAKPELEDRTLAAGANAIVFKGTGLTSILNELRAAMRMHGVLPAE